MFRYLYRLALGAYWGTIIVAIIATPAHAGTVEITGETDWWFTLDDTSEVIIYGNSNRDCEQLGADPYLWLYDDTGQLLLSDDDSNHGIGQCFSSKLFITLNAGQYRVHAGYCCSQREDGFNGGTYELVSQLATFGTTTTSTSTTTTTTSTTTTSSTTSTTTTSTTTTTTLPTTTTSTTTTSTTTTSTTSTTLPPTTTTTTTTIQPATTSTTTTTPTTLPPTTITTSTTEAPPPATTTTSSSTTTTSSTSSTSTTTSTTTTSTTTTSTTLPATTTTISAPTQTTSTLPTPPADASDAEKQQFEQTINIYSTPGYDNYVPAGSTVNVATRRTVTAAAVVLGTVPTFAPRRRHR